MIELYRSANLVKVGYYKSVLESAGIDCYIKNETIALTEIPIPVFYPALFILHDKDTAEALRLLEENAMFEHDDSSDTGEKNDLPDIICPHCAAENPANFTECWSCSKPLFEK